MMDIHESAQEFRHLAAKSTEPAVSDDDEEMVLNYSDSEDDHSSKVSKSENLKEDLDLLDKDNQMEVTDNNIPDKQHNGIAATATITETVSNDKQNDENALITTEKISLLDRFLSSEVVENGKENISELIGDELVDEVANEVIDENALLDEITNDLDQDELDDECLLEDDIAEMDAAATSTVSTSKSADEPTISNSNGERNDEAVEDVVDPASDTVIGSGDVPSEPQLMEVDDHESIENNCKADSTEVSSEMETEIVDPKSSETVIDESASTTKVDEDNDNNLLEEMLDSPRSSENGSMTSEMLEKDDTSATRDSNEDETKQQLIVQSSNENSNMSETGEPISSDVVGEFKHDGEIHIMDDAGVSLESNVAAVDDVDVKAPKEEIKLELDVNIKTETKIEGVALKEEVKAELESEAVSPNEEVVNQTSSDSLEKFGEEEVANHATPSPEPPCKRKSDEEISEPENKKKRLEEEVPSVGSPEKTVSADNDIDIAAINDDNATAEDEDSQKETTDTNREDDDDVLIVGDMNEIEKTADTQSSTETTEVQEPVQKAKILILDTQAIVGDLCDDAGEKSSVVPENDPQVSSSQDESIVEKEAELSVETTEKTSERRAKTPTALTLDPAPQKTLCPTAFSLNFVRKFQKNFDKMNRNDLEELLIQKCVEVIVHKSDYAEMRNKIEKQESKLQSYSAKYQELSKQYRDLEMVHQRVIKDLEVKNQSVVTPVKITRAVGLQVSLPRKEIAVQKSPVAAPAAPTPPTAPANAMQNIAQQNAAMARNRRKVPTQRPNDPSLTSAQQQQHQQQQQQILRQNIMLSRRPEIQMQQRNQFHLQQQQGQNNLLKQQLVQNNNPNNLRQPANIRKPGSQFSPVAANQIQNSSPKTPNSAERQRVPPVILKKMTPTRMVTVNNPGSNAAMYSSQPKVANSRTSATSTSSSTNNLIDLTDEEDSRRVTQNGTNPPALVAIPNNHGNKTVVGQGKVNFVTVKSGTPHAQLQMVQQNRLASMQKVGGAYVPIAPKSNGSTGQIVQFRQKQQPATTLTAVQRRQHPAPLPYPNNQQTNPHWKLIPPRPIIRISNNIEAGIVISWTMDEMTDKHAEVASYQIYAYQETTAAPSPETWRHVGDVKAMLLPMAVTLTQFQEGQRYHFAVRAVDEHSRYGVFSLPKTWT